MNARITPVAGNASVDVHDCLYVVDSQSNLVGLFQIGGNWPNPRTFLSSQQYSELQSQEVSRGWCSHVSKHHHKTKIHVGLLVAVKQRRARVCRDKVDLRITLRLHHDHVFAQPRERPVVEARDLERMAM